MLDNLKDLLSHTTGMDFDIIKITANEDGVATIDALTADRQLILKGDFKNEIVEFEGVFGLSKLDILSKIVNMYNMPTDKVKVTKDFKKVPLPVLDADGNHEYDQYDNPKMESIESNVVDSITFTRSTPRMKNNYRVVASGMIPASRTLRQAVNYDIVVSPTTVSIDILKQQASLGVCETIQFETSENSDGTYKLTVVLGDSQREAEILFVDNINDIGNWNNGHSWRWSINTCLAVFQYAKNADLSIALSSKGIIKTTVNTGLAEYNYLMPALTA